MGEKPNDPTFRILATSRVFQVAPSSDLERLASHCLCERYRRGAEIVRRGAPGDSLAVLGRGRVKNILPSPTGEAEFVTAMFWPGDVFGEIAAFDRRARAGTVIAVTEAEVVFVPRTELMSLLERRPAVAIRLIESLCEKLRASLDLSLGMRFLDVASRFYQRLLYLSRFDAHRDGIAVRIQHGLSQQELADSIGASREALNKVISDWKRAGLVEWGRGYVVVNDPALLAQRISPSVRNEAFLGMSAVEQMLAADGDGSK
jgi:CRP/FNR family transcriptional regulator, cyclic AMP receptor protein